MKSLLRYCLCRLFAASCLVVPAAAGESVQVQLASGRVFVAAVDARTDAAALWLRFDSESTTLLRPLAWDSVVSVQLGDATLTAEQFRSVAPSVSSRAPAVERVAARQGTPAVPASMAQRAAEALGAHSQAVSLDVTAYAANWDADAEVDGIVVEVRPLDADGALVQVPGTLTVELLADRPGAFPLRKYTIAAPVRTHRLGRWVRSVDHADVGSRGAVVRLPFQAADPQFTPDLGPWGSVHVRMSVPGRAALEATVSTVRVRPYSPARDIKQQRGESRFFEVERTGRGKPAAYRGGR